eukprot:229229_1
MTAVAESDESSDEAGDEQEIFIKSPQTITRYSPAEQIEKEVEHIISTTQAAKQAGDIDTDDHLVIFIHGFNNSDDNVESRADKIDQIYGTRNVITRTFNWKSKNHALKYGSDQYTALLVAQSFAKYIELIRSYNHFRRIDIVCHSMGNFILSQTILHFCAFNNKLNIFEGCNIICLAADVETKQYNKTIEAVKDIVSSWCHYWCAGDNALQLSKRHNEGNRKSRAGLSACRVRFGIVQDIEWKAWSYFSVNHGYIDQVFSDIELAKDILDRLNRIHQRIPPHIIQNDDDDAKDNVAIAQHVDYRMNAQRNKPFVLKTGFGYIGCDKNGWLIVTDSVADAIVFEAEVSSSRYKYTHYKFKRGIHRKYRGWYLSYTGNSWCAGLYENKKDALCIEYCVAENKLIARGTERRIEMKKMEARELRSHRNKHLYWRNDYQPCQVMFDYDFDEPMN